LKWKECGRTAEMEDIKKFRTECDGREREREIDMSARKGLKDHIFVVPCTWTGGSFFGRSHDPRAKVGFGQENKPPL
jgi:hypothetical protein